MSNIPKWPKPKNFKGPVRAQDVRNLHFKSQIRDQHIKMHQIGPGEQDFSKLFAKPATLMYNKVTIHDSSHSTRLDETNTLVYESCLPHFELELLQKNDFRENQLFDLA